MTLASFDIFNEQGEKVLAIEGPPAKCQCGPITEDINFMVSVNAQLYTDIY